MKKLTTRTAAALVIALLGLSGCTAHCTCPAQQPATTTVVTPSN